MRKLAWLLCLYTLIAGCNGPSGESRVSGRWYTQSQVASGKAVYLDYCVNCHRDSARGTENWKVAAPDGKYPPPPLNGSAHAWHHPLGVLKRVIAEGGIPLGGTMPAFGSKLNEGETLAVISYFQSFWGDDTYSAWIARGGLK